MAAKTFFHARKCCECIRAVYPGVRILVLIANSYRNVVVVWCILKIVLVLPQNTRVVYSWLQRSLCNRQSRNVSQRMLVVREVVQLCFATSQSLCLKFLDQELISYRYSLLLLLFFFFFLGHLFKKPRAPSFQIISGWNFAGTFLRYIRIDWRSRISDLTSHFRDGGHDVISHRKVLPSGKWHAASAQRLCSSLCQFILV